MPSNYKVLLIEDNGIDQSAFKRVVTNKKLPYDYKIAGSVSSAKQFLSSEKFDIVIIDYFLGDGTGFDVLNNIPSGVITIFVTGADDAEIAIKALNSGAYEYIIKDEDHNYLNFLPATIENAIKHQANESRSRMLNHAIMHVKDRIYIIDKSDKIIFVNKSFCSTYGYKDEEILGQHSYQVWKDTSQMNSEGTFIHKKKDGSEITVSLTRSTLKDKNDQEIAYVIVIYEVK